MALSILKKRAAKKAMEKAKLAYVKATTLSGISRESRIFKTRIGMRSRAHLDKVFIEGAEQAEAYQEACLTAISNGTERPAMPEPRLFQSIKTQKETIYTYVPLEFSKEMFALGSMYQTVVIGPAETIKLAQEIADKVSLDLDLDEPFLALQFLRDELESNVDSTSDAIESAAKEPAAAQQDTERHPN